LSVLASNNAQKPTQAKPPVEMLSEREIEVLRLIAAGFSNRKIGETLSITAGTAKTHVHNICGKLAVQNRTEAAILAKDLGII
jgi:ATP/maltotriose-dependent transcriptional regulator MalT